MKRLRDSLGKTPSVEGRLENLEDIISSGHDFDASKVGLLIETTIPEHLGQHLHDHSLFGGAQKPVRVFSLAQFRVELAYFGSFQAMSWNPGVGGSRASRSPISR